MKKSILFIFSVLKCTVYAQQWSWVYPINSNSGSSINDVQTDSAGNPYFIGKCSNSTVFNGQNGLFPISGLNSFVAKYDALGNIYWISGGWGSSIDGNSMSLDKHSNCFLTGAFDDTASFGIGTDTLKRTSFSNSHDYFLVKLDNEGKAVFFKSGGGICNDFGASVTTFSSDEIIVFWKDQTECLYDDGNTDHFEKLSSDGSLIWSMNSPDIHYGTFFPNNITSTKDGGFLLLNQWFGYSLCCLSPLIDWTN